MAGRPGGIQAAWRRQATYHVLGGGHYRDCPGGLRYGQPNLDCGCRDRALAEYAERVAEDRAAQESASRLGPRPGRPGPPVVREFKVPTVCHRCRRPFDECLCTSGEADDFAITDPGSASAFAQWAVVVFIFVVLPALILLVAWLL